ncbi:MAG: hypothetical protein IPM13_05840 [Phycisphaerales bacterium]|nr:hypothetical protein [Phycisphaerales bacterium]
MLRRRSLIAFPLVTGLVLLVCASAQAQWSDDDEPPPLFLLTDQVIDLAVDRIVDDMADHYKFDEDQFLTVREEIRARFPQFLKENRNEFIRIMNDYAVALLGEDPPSPQFVADWAQRTQPLLTNFVGLIRETADTIRPVLNDQQQLQMDGELAAFNVGVDYATRRLQVWSDGGFDWETEWVRSEKFREEQARREQAVVRAQEEAKTAALTGQPMPELGPLDGEVTPPPATGGAQPTAKPAPVSTRPAEARPKDDWEIYTEQFIQRYKLDAAQQESARRILASSQQDRDRYLARRGSDIQAAERKLAAAANDDERARAKAERERLRAPIDRTFSRLKERLDVLPSRKQRAEAAKADTERPPAGKAREGERSAEGAATSSGAGGGERRGQ